MDVSALLIELYGRIPPLVTSAVQGLDAEDLARSPAPGANTIGWLVWHLSRVQDHHVAELLDERQLWVQGWAERFGLDADPDDIGYGHTREQMEAVRPPNADVLIDYHLAVHERTERMLHGIDPHQLGRIVDRSWDPPVTMGVRLVSVADDSLQHIGQAAYLRGMFDAD